MNIPYSFPAFDLDQFHTTVDGEGGSREQLKNLIELFRRIIDRLKQESESLRCEMVNTVAELFGPNVMFALRNRQGFTKEEAKKLFYSFRSGGQKNSEENPEKSKPDPAKGVVEAKTTEDKIDQIVVYMRETSNKLDRIEDDINFLKEQVDRILEKL